MPRRQAVEIEEFEPVVRPRRRIRIVVLLALLTVITAVVGSAPSVQRWWRGETDWRGRRIYEPPHGVDAGRFAEVDLEAVHGELLPAWLVAQGRRARGHAGDEEAKAFEALRAAAAPDPNLVSLLEQLRAISPTPVLREEPRRALYLSWAWNAYLDRYQAPFHISGTVMAARSGPALAATTYRVHGDLQVRVGSDTHRVRIGSRIDGLNVHEEFLGAAGREEALVVVDRLRDFALADVWPLLDPTIDDQLPARHAFGRALREEAARRLPPEAFEALRRGARPRWSIVRIILRLHERRRQCGVGIRINEIPWGGFSSERLERLSEMAERHRERDCPGITPQEVEELSSASEALARIPELRPAVEELVAWTSEHVTIHEARHLADAEHADGFDEPLPCRSCPDTMGIVARAELSGYLASLAWSSSPAVALHQACRALASDHRMTGRPVTGPHREAMELLQRRIGPVCIDGPPPDLRALGRLLEEEMLGRSEPIALSEDHPRRLPVTWPP